MDFPQNSHKKGVGAAWLCSYSVTSLKEIAWSRDPVLEVSRLKVRFAFDKWYETIELD